MKGLLHRQNKSYRSIKIMNFNSELQIKRFKSEIFPSIYRTLSDAVDRPQPSKSDVPIGCSGFKNHQQYYAVKKQLRIVTRLLKYFGCTSKLMFL
jgi:hypothetical protein